MPTVMAERVEYTEYNKPGKAGLENHKADDEHVRMPPTATSMFYSLH